MMVDKTEITQQILQLDIMKNQTLKQTFDVVSTAFSKIFSTLLPGAQA